MSSGTSASAACPAGVLGAGNSGAGVEGASILSALARGGLAYLRPLVPAICKGILSTNMGTTSPPKSILTADIGKA